MVEPIDFEFREVLELFESSGWKLWVAYGKYRVFVKHGKKPYVLPVNDNNKVNIEHVNKAKEFLENEEEIEKL
ncbi:MAG: hypothetical protein ACYS1A_03365 [Planctomycetota bacterium]|jgi:hypothetical protein